MLFLENTFCECHFKTSNHVENRTMDQIYEVSGLGQGIFLALQKNVNLRKTHLKEPNSNAIFFLNGYKKFDK